MISLEDCIGMCGLDENEVAAIAEHEHIPEIAAAALASYLLNQPHGGEAIRTMIIWPPSAWLKLPKSWRPASCVSARNSPALYLHPPETVSSTSRPRRAVVVANHAAELEGDDADCTNDHRGRTASAG